ESYLRSHFLSVSGARILQTPAKPSKTSLIKPGNAMMRFCGNSSRASLNTLFSITLTVGEREAVRDAPKIPAASFMPLLDLKLWWTTLRTSSEAGAVDSAGPVWVFATAVYNSYTKYPYVA